MFFNYKSILIGVLILFSCENNQKLAKDLAQLQSQSIKLPQTCRIIADGRDTSITDIFVSDLKLIVYIDSTGCTSCSISKMYTWEGFVEYAKPYNGQLKYYFIYSPTKKDANSVRMAIYNNLMFNYPVLIDTLGEFEKLNPHLPKNKVFHTFLLDEKNNVVLVGNPLHNKKVEEMFYKIVEEKLGKPH